MKKMKKVVSALLTAAMVMTSGIVVLADTVTTTITDYESGKIANDAEINFVFTKEYQTSTGTTPAKYPAETLKFTVIAAATNPDNTLISIADQTVDSNPDNILVTVPVYTNVGKYNYTVSEVEGNTQGVIYSDNTFDVQVIVTWNDNHSAKERQIAFTKKESDESNNKVDKIVNTYDLGSLAVSKTVTGNLGDQTKEFTVDVTFSATKDVKSDITYDDGNETKTITASEMAGRSKKVEITVKHGETVNFTNIPEGVTYVVSEHDYVTKENSANTIENDANGYDAPIYTNSDNSETTTSNGEIDLITNDETGEVTGTDADTVGITNNKGTEVNTGISLDNMPYIMLLAIAALGLVGFVSKKRSIEF